ncbi:MAG: DUF1289 domain-containing protein [Methylobacter sp.]|nr:DUF1289 domain-containing protein [Methylobacter sp.]
MTASDLSPCVRMCCLDDENICLGCFRSLDEIGQWRELTTQQRQEILNTVNARKLAHKI